MPRIISCREWGARLPRRAIEPAGRPDKVLFHHTAGHWHETDHGSGESWREAFAYVKSIQNYHMDGHGWNDTGQNFTVTRNGMIFEGRHGSLAAVTQGKMVVSAHCPGQNENPGVEIEHVDSEPMTDAQYASAVWLFAWICKCCEISPLQIKGHRDYFATACPGSLYLALPKFRQEVAKTLQALSDKKYTAHTIYKDDSEHWLPVNRAGATFAFSRFLAGKYKSLELTRAAKGAK